jgi:membrane associated rhomboid family serine protease
LAIPSNVSVLLHRFWTPISYMFLHKDFFHILFNMLCFFWLGRIFLSAFSQRHLVGLYFVGGLFAALFYIVAFNVFPYYESLIAGSMLLGASGSVIAIIVASATKFPNMGIRLFLVGNIKLKYIAIFLVLINIFGITGNEIITDKIINEKTNFGGAWAHLGGALAGYLFIVFLNKGTDITAWFNKIIDAIVNLFKPRTMRVKKVKYNTAQPNRKMTDQEYNMNKVQNMAEIDRILDKIKESGYDSLSAEDKKRLFEQKK